MSARPARRQRRAERVAWIVGIAGAVLLALAASRDRTSAAQSYLFVWWFLLGLPLGSMMILMVHNLTGGGWGELIRPPLEAALNLLPASLALAVPLLFGLPALYAWARSSDVAADPLLQAKAWYLASDFFLLRTAVIFAVWLALAYLLRRWSAARFLDAGLPDARRLRATSAIGLLLYGVTVTVAAVDWIMSLTPQWYSTAFGLLVGVGWPLSALALAIIVTVATAANPRECSPDHLQDLGKLLLMFVMTWTYLAYMQYLIVWAEDLPHEIAWYLPRQQTDWRAVLWFLIVFHFALPFLFLLSRRAKRSAFALTAIAVVLLVAHFVDAFWLVVPSLRPAGFALSWSDLLAVLFPGAVLVALFVRNVDAWEPDPGRAARGREVIDHG
jgi:hypothetical protein